MKDKHTNSPIRQRRKAMGLTMQELGELTGIEPGTIAGAELGRNGISKATSEKLAAVFQCDAGELLEEAGLPVGRQEATQGKGTWRSREHAKERRSRLPENRRRKAQKRKQRGTTGRK